MNLLQKIWGHPGFIPWRSRLAKYRTHISLWHHSANVAYIAYNLAKTLTKDENKSKVAFLAGLFHDAAKAEEVTEQFFTEIGKQLELSDSEIKVAWLLAQHAEAPGAPPLTTIPKEYIKDYQLLSDIVATADSLASAITIREVERGYVLEDEDYWIEETPRRRYLEAWRRLKAKGLKLGTIVFDYYINPSIRAKVLNSIQSYLSKEGWSPLLVFHDGVLFYTTRGSTARYDLELFVDYVLSELEKTIMGEEEEGVQERIALTRDRGIIEVSTLLYRIAKGKSSPDELKELEEKQKAFASALIDYFTEVFSELKGLEKPTKPKLTIVGKSIITADQLSPATIESLLGRIREELSREEDPASRYALLANLFARITFDVYSSLKGAKIDRPKEVIDFLKLAKGKRDYIAKVMPRVIKLCEEAGEEKILVFLKEFLTEAFRAQSKERISRLRADIEILLYYYLSGTLVKKKPIKIDLSKTVFCDLCGTPFHKENVYAAVSSLFSKLNLQVKYWMVHQKPLDYLDRFTGKNMKVCPFCYIDITVFSKTELSPPYAILSFYPVVAPEVFQHIFLVSRSMGEALFAQISEPEARKRVREVGERMRMRRLLASRLLFYIYNNIQESLLKLKHYHGGFELAYRITEWTQRELASLVSEEEEEEFSEEVRLGYYCVSIPVPLGKAFPRLKSVDVSKTTSIAYAPALALLSMLTGCKTYLSDKIEPPPEDYAVVTPANVYFPAKFWGKGVKPHETVQSLLLQSLVVLVASSRAGYRMRELNAEFLRMYSLLKNSPYILDGCLKVINRLINIAEVSSDYLNSLMFLIRGVVDMSGSNIDKRLVEHLDKVIEFLNNRHYIRPPYTRHKLIAPVNIAIEKLFELLPLLSSIGEESVLELAASEFSRRVEEDDERAGYGIKGEELERGKEYIKNVLKVFLEIYKNKKDTRLVRSMANSVRTYVYISRRIYLSKKFRKEG